MTHFSLKAFALLAGVITVGTGTANAATCGVEAPRAAISKRVVSAVPTVRVDRAVASRPVRVTRAAVVRSAPALPQLRPIVSAPSSSSSASFSSSVFSGITGGGDGGGGGGGGSGM